MGQVLLDTNFILNCINQKIDFFEDLAGYKIIIPQEVINEIKKITESKKKFKFRNTAKLALSILEKNKFEKIDLGKGYVDKKIKSFAEKNNSLIIATLDQELKKSLKNPKIVIRKKKKLEII